METQEFLNNNNNSQESKLIVEFWTTSVRNEIPTATTRMFNVFADLYNETKNLNLAKSIFIYYYDDLFNVNVTAETLISDLTLRLI